MNDSRADGATVVNRYDPCWKDLSECPIENGWYDICFFNEKKQQYMLALGLFRNGEWIDLGGDKRRVEAWKEPLKMRDMKGHGIQNKDGAINLAGTIIGGICDDYRKAYKSYLRNRYTDHKSAEDARLRMESLERLICSPYFSALSMGAMEGQDVVQTLIRQVEKTANPYTRK